MAPAHMKERRAAMLAVRVLGGIVAVVSDGGRVQRVPLGDEVRDVFHCLGHAGEEDECKHDRNAAHQGTGSKGGRFRQISGTPLCVAALAKAEDVVTPVPAP